MRGATVLTPTERLSRELTRQVGLAHRRRGRTSWPTPDVLPFDAFIRRLWREWLIDAEGSAPVLLTPLQERTVFEHVIAESEHDLPLQIGSTARAALEAWRLVHAWQIPLSDSRFTTADDSDAFLRWARAFEDRCGRGNWLDTARLPAFIVDGLRGGSLEAPSRVALAGFDELTPQQKSLLAALPHVEPAAAPAHDSAPAQTELSDAAEEFEQAAQWARGLLERDPAARIGVIVPNLAECRAQVDRIFREILHPGAFVTGLRAYHIALGLALADYPIVAAALLALESGLPRIPADRVGMLLRSPFIGNASVDIRARADADLRLRRDAQFELIPARMRTLHPALNPRLDPQPERQRPAAWSRSFSQILSAWGWPGDHTLSSDEHQSIEAWNQTLSAFASLDVIVADLSYEEALRDLRRLARSTMFQPEDVGAPVQVMGTGEAAGLEFDSLWITGVTDEQFPRQPRPNPFLPLSIQREMNLPHSTPQREADDAAALMQRLIASADDVRLSWPANDGEKELQPSPLIERLGADRIPPNLPDPRPRGWHRAAQLESIGDETVPPLAADAAASGGTRLLKDVSDCPFRAFALYRLGAKPLEEAAFGVPATEKGRAVHRALELIWQELGSYDNLVALTEEQQRELIRRHVKAALLPSPFRDLEQTRLERLIGEFLELERNRQPFNVRRHEEKRSVTVGGLTVQIRVDREDELDDGRLVLIDYKTSKSKNEVWIGERPREPQLPLYATTAAGRLAAVTLATIRTGEVGFTGIQEGDVLGGAKTMRKECATLAEERERWRNVLEHLAAEFRGGDARVDPAPSACKYCELKALCRVRDYSTTEEPDADE